MNGNIVARLGFFKIVGFFSIFAFLFVLFFLYKIFFLKENESFFEVKSGPFVEDVIARGKVEGVLDAKLGFKNQGKVSLVNVKIGDFVKEDQELVLQDTRSYDSQIAEMDSNIRLQRARLAQLKAGSSLEEIEIADSLVSEASTAVGNSETLYKNTKQTIIDKLKNSYTVSEDVMRNKVDKIFINPQSENPKLILSPASNFGLGPDLESSRLSIEKELKIWESDVNSLNVDNDISSRIVIFKNRLLMVKDFLEKTSSFVNNPINNLNYLPQTTWDVLKSDISSSRIAIDLKISELTQAENSLSEISLKIKSSNDSLNTAKKQLDQKKASVRGTDLAVYFAQIDQAISSRKKIESQRNDFVITAPFSGIITDVDIKVGEVAGPAKNIVSILSYDKLQVKVNVVENNITKIKIGQDAILNFDAMNGKEYFGKVVFIDPAEEEINGTVYYKVTVELNEKIDFLRPGMSSDVRILTKKDENSVFVPISALINDKDINHYEVFVFKNGSKYKKSVEIGSRNSDGMVQIISGLEEGERVILMGK